MSFGKKIQQLRRKFKLKQIDLSNSLRVSAQAVSKWERDENYPDILTLKKIARLFNVSVDELLGMYDEECEVFEATVFCSGINQFAKKAKGFSPDHLAKSMNALFIQMTEAVLKNGGIPIKYTGDGFLCFFSGAQHADRAVDSAFSISRAHIDKEIVVLLNEGAIFLGKIGHPDYASKDIYGDSVNRTFLMMEAFSSKVKKGIGCSLSVKKALQTQHKFKIWRELNFPHLAETGDIYELKK